MTAGCTKFYKVISGDGCWAIANANSIALTDFYAWNPAVGSDCQTLQPDYYVCVGRAPVTSSSSVTKTSTSLPQCSWNASKGQYDCPVATSAPATKTSSTELPRCSWNASKGQYDCPGTPTPTPTNTRPPPPGPTQAGIPSNCNKWVLQKTGVYCYDMAAAAGISLDRLYQLNPALNGDCSGLWPNYAYCIGVA